VSFTLGAMSLFHAPRRARYHRGIAVELNHTIVAARDARASADFLSEILGLDPPVRVGHFLAVSTGNGVSLDFASVGAGETITAQHYAFLVSEDEFDAIFARVRRHDLQIWADPRQARPGEINHDHGRGFYFLDPSGHFLEVLTVPYTP
jgi:catechol 2,3-dioxygenase-like lactoylglutathione lyase family enzyme